MHTGIGMTMDPGFMLARTDDAVHILQTLIVDLLKYLEAVRKSNSDFWFDAPHLETVELTYGILNEILASLWPCEKKCVAVIGPTGSGKSTLLNHLVAMTCRTGEAYKDGLLQESSRAALRETARQHAKHSTGLSDIKRLTMEPETSKGSFPIVKKEQFAVGTSVDIDAEERALSGLLGICCAEFREIYLGKHLPLYDKRPFLLLNGRMGDAGTSKVTSVVWGSKFIARIGWTDKRTLRKQLKLLRRLSDEGSDLKDEDRNTLKELKELWACILDRTGHHLIRDSHRKCQEPKVTDELMNKALAELEKVIPLGKDEVIEMDSSQGCTLDRLHVRNGLQRRLVEQKLGLLASEITIEAPIPSSEGGVGLLDVPGTNDPRVLHQRETRDALEQTSLVLLILDKSVVDKSTEKVLEESPVLERILLDDSLQTRLVVVGIAEKAGVGFNQTPSDIVNNFDPNQGLTSAMKSVFKKKAKCLVKSRRLPQHVALTRVDDIFNHSTGRFCVLPVLPCLCASIQLSSANPALHRQCCESPTDKRCPLTMTPEERRDRCMQTNIPKLLEKIYSVRMPPSADYLHDQLGSAISLLDSMLTKNAECDETMVQFLEKEQKYCQSKSSRSLVLGNPDDALCEEHIKKTLGDQAKECELGELDIAFVTPKLGTVVAVRAVSEKELAYLAPLILRGFKPEDTANLTRKILAPVEVKATLYVEHATKCLTDMRNGGLARREAALDEVSGSCLGSCVALLEKSEERWRLSLNRLRANLLCGGSKGGLHAQVRMALRKSCDISTKEILKDLRKHRNDDSVGQTLNRILVNNVAGQKMAAHAFVSVLREVASFWRGLAESFDAEVHRLWKAWNDEVAKTARATRLAVSRNGQGQSVVEGSDPSGFATLQASLERKIFELKDLANRLKTGLDPSLKEAFYGYSLLQENPCFNFPAHLRTGEPSLHLSHLPKDLELEVELFTGGAIKEEESNYHGASHAFPSRLSEGTLPGLATQIPGEGQSHILKVTTTQKIKSVKPEPSEEQKAPSQKVSSRGLKLASSTVRRNTSQVESLKLSGDSNRTETSRSSLKAVNHRSPTPGSRMSNKKHKM